jgi:CRP/FNR family transcriptional regulator
MQILTVSQVQKLDALQNSSYFTGLKENILEELAQGATLRFFDKAEIIFWDGDPCAGLHIIHQGSVKLYKISPQGREMIIKVFEEGETFNEVPVFDRGLNPVNVAALEPCQVWVVDADVIQELMQLHPDMCQAVILNLTRNLRMLVGLVEELSFYQVTNRLARLIGQLPPEQLAGPAPGRITQDQLAARLGTVREVVARSLRELERSGAILVENRQIQILDLEMLQDWAQVPCS